VFAAVVPFAALAALIAVRTMSEQPAKSSRGIDIPGAVLITLALGGIVGGLTVGSDRGFRSTEVSGLLAGGAACLVAFLLIERKSRNGILPLDIFASVQFTGANVVTLLVYAALSALLFFLMLELQNVLGYSALRAGASLLPVNGLMLLLSPFAGRTAERIGAKLPMSIGAAVAAAGMVLFSRVQPGATYVGTILPAATVFGLGLSIFVAPLTAAVLAAVPSARVGVASAVNNAVSRVAGLLALAILPLAAGLSGAKALAPAVLTEGFARGMWISAGLCAAGGVVAFFTISSGTSSRRGATAKEGS
jgi:Na+/melibiose symporter-like transporter